MRWSKEKKNRKIAKGKKYRKVNSTTFNFINSLAVKVRSTYSTAKVKAKIYSMFSLDASNNFIVERVYCKLDCDN